MECPPKKQNKCLSTYYICWNCAIDECHKDEYYWKRYISLHWIVRKLFFGKQIPWLFINFSALLRVCVLFLFPHFHERAEFVFYECLNGHEDYEVLAEGRRHRTPHRHIGVENVLMAWLLSGSLENRPHQSPDWLCRLEKLDGFNFPARQAKRYLIMDQFGTYTTLDLFSLRHILGMSKIQPRYDDFHQLLSGNNTSTYRGQEKWRATRQS